MSSWAEYLDQALTLMPNTSVDTLVLPDDHIEKVLVKKKWTDRNLQRLDKDGWRYDVYGKKWGACFSNHIRVRQHIAEMFGMTPPSCRDFVDKVWRDANDQDWKHLLTCRQIDVLELHGWVLEKSQASPPHPTANNFHWDLENNVYMERNKHPSWSGVLPCIPKNHVLWDVNRARPWIGFELMMAQGFPNTLKTGVAKDHDLPMNVQKAILRLMHTHGQHRKECSVTDRDLCALAGNTMTVPIMMLLQVLPSVILIGNMCVIHSQPL